MLASDSAAAALPYLVLREHFINRLDDMNRGYWQPGFQGADTLTQKELGEVLVHYGGLDAKQLAVMIEAGDYELALRVLCWVRPHHPEDERLAQLEQRVLIKPGIRPIQSHLVWRKCAVECGRANTSRT